MEVVRLLEMVDRNDHWDLPIDEYLRVYKKLEKYLHHELSKGSIQKGPTSLS